MTEQTQTETTSNPRTFWHSDYRKTCDLIKSFRHVHCQPYTAKLPVSQAWIDKLAAELATVFELEAEASGTVFNVARFIKDTQLPVKPEDVSEYADHLGETSGPKVAGHLKDYGGDAPAPADVEPAAVEYGDEWGMQASNAQQVPEVEAGE